MNGAYFIMTKKIKSEHARVKNGAVYWGTRHEAKSLAKKLKRIRIRP
jgi:hypothetical protein